MLFVLALIGLLSTMAVPMLKKAQGTAQASSALVTMRMINSAQLSFAITCGLGFYAPDLPSLGAPPPSSTEGFIAPEMASGLTVIRSGYSFTVEGIPLAGAPATCNGLAANTTAPTYVITADPLNPQQHSPRFFASNADGVVYEHDATLSGIMPPAGTPAVGIPVNR